MLMIKSTKVLCWDDPLNKCLRKALNRNPQLVNIKDQKGIL